MRRHGPWMVAILITACLCLAGCAATATSSEAADGSGDAAKADSIGDTSLKRVTLAQAAADRLAIRTAVVGETKVASSGRKKVARRVIPYAAVLYDVNGDAWVYTVPEPLVYVRHRITVDYVDGDRAVLSEGPPPGTAIVTVGVAELYGIEVGVGASE
jgi:hypothetical protein